MSHTTRGCDGCQEGCESGYYHLHRYLNNTIRLHNFQSSKFKVSILPQVVTTGIAVTALVLATAILRRSVLSVTRRSVLIVLNLAAVARGDTLQNN